MKSLQIFTILFLGLACNPPKKEVNKTLENSTINSKETDSKTLLVQVDTNSIKSTLAKTYTLNDIQGVWGENLEENAYFLIKGCKLPRK